LPNSEKKGSAFTIYKFKKSQELPTLPSDGRYVVDDTVEPILFVVNDDGKFVIDTE
jgi:hypothetical protein